MKYTIKDLRKQFPTEDKCLDHIFNVKHPKAEGYYRVKGRKCYANTKGHQIHPLKGTIFEKSSTPLGLWFHAIFLFSVSKNGVSAKELERQLGVTYKTAWRMAHQIRKLMEQDGDKLTGTVEADETYFGGRKRGSLAGRGTSKTPIVGVVERGGKIRVKAVERVHAGILGSNILKNVDTKAELMTDDFAGYRWVRKFFEKNGIIHHGKKEYVRGNVHTNTIEGFWFQFKTSVKGTHHSVSKKHLQAYLNEFAYRYSNRASVQPLFQMLVQKASQ